MRDKFIKLENIILNSKNSLVNDFGKAIKRDEIFSLLSFSKLTPSEGFLELFLWKDGVNTSLILKNYNKYLFSYGVYGDFLGLNSFYLMEKGNRLFDKKFFPLCFSPQGDKIIIDLKQKSKTFGQLFLFNPSITLSDKPVSIFDNVETMVDTIIECYEKDVYKINWPSGDFMCKYDLEHEIGKKNNPKSSYWKE